MNMPPYTDLDKENSNCNLTSNLVMTIPRESLSTTIDRKVSTIPRLLSTNRLSSGNVNGRMRSASVGRDKKSDLRARYWAFLFENLQHAVDELYQTCEMDENISECKEVILVLENYTREFHNLAEWFRVKWEYENTPPPQRPNSLAWEIRKSSPGKIFRKACQPQLKGIVRRDLIYELNKPPKIAELEPSIPPSKLIDTVLQLKPCENQVTSDNQIPPPVTQSSLDLETNHCQRVDNCSQTDNEPMFKKSLTNIGRKIVPSSSYTKKMARSLSISSVPEKSNFLPYSTKRFAGCVSPRKPVPGLNIAAPEFEPGRKNNLNMSKLQESKARISRSHSDSVFETAVVESRNNEKQYCSTESVNGKSTKSDGSQSPECTPSNSLDIINESPSKGSDSTTTTSIIGGTVDSAQISSKEVILKQDPINADCPIVNEKTQTLKPDPVKSKSIEEEKKTDTIKKVIPKTNVSTIVSRNRPNDKHRTTLTERHNNRPISSTTRFQTKRVVNKVKESYAKASENAKISSPKIPLENNTIEEKNKTGNTEEKKIINNSCRNEKPNLSKTQYSNIAKSNSFQESFKHHNNRYPNMVRSKTSIDMKTNNKRTNSGLPPHPRSKLNESLTKLANDERESPPKNRRSSKDNDGWETVISRSRRSIPNSLNFKNKPFDVNKRFYEPSPSTSLPTLAMPEVNSNGNKKQIDAKNKNRNRNNSQNSNNSLRDQPNVNKGYEGYKLNKERPIMSSTALFTTIPSKKKKINEKARTLSKRKSSKELDTRMKEDLLDEESLRKSKELYEKEISLQKEINDLQNDDTETDFDVDSDGTEVDQEIVELCKINEEVNSSERRAVLKVKYNHILSHMSWAEQVETLDKLEELLMRDPSGKSLKFAKNFTCLQQFEDLVTRAPGRALELHQKLSSPSRKRISPDSTILQHKARQAKAKQNREQLLQDKSAKIRELFNKVAEVKTMRAQLANERRKMLEEKLKRAEENRNLHLKNIQEKAHDEAKKQKEIAFIKELEAQNKRHDFYALCQEQEDRLQSILGERQRRQEEKAAKEAAVEERRKAIEAERQEKIEELQEKMRRREERIDRELQEKERERIKMAREKARDREDRLLALQAAQIANAEELQKKIQQKQENSARRHEENIELIRQKAIEIGTPRLTPYQINKLCSVCNVVIDSEVFLLSHLKGKSHQESVKKYREQFEANVKFSECSIITDAPADVLHEKRNREKERQKMLRKRCKKIRQRLNSRSEEYKKIVSDEKDKNKKYESSNKGRLLKSIKDVEKLINAQGNGIWPNNAVTLLERNLFEIIRVLEKGNKNDQYLLKEFEGFAVLSKIYNLALDLPKNMSPYLPLKCFMVTSNLYAAACQNNCENCLYVLLSNNIVQIVDLLLNRLNLIMPNSDDRNGMVVYKADTVADVLMNLCSNLLSTITPLTCDENNTENPKCNKEMVSAHLQDVVSYIVCTGIVDKLAVYCSSVHDNKNTDSYFLLHCMELLAALVETRRGKITEKEDCSQLMATLKATELVGAVSMLYAMLLHQDSMSNDSQLVTTTVLPPDVVNVIIATLRFFSKVGELNLTFFQNILGAEGISLQVRHIISYLLRFCTQNDGYKDLLHQVIEFIGFFAIHHTDNQMILQSGSTPTVLQQLSSLPFAYFSNPNLVRILFPTLLACCVRNVQNRKILDQELSFELLEDFRNAEDSKDIPLIKLLRVN